MYGVGPGNYIVKIKVITVNNYYNSDGKKLKCMWYINIVWGTLKFDCIVSIYYT